jgi:hypothetical protein
MGRCILPILFLLLPSIMLGAVTSDDNAPAGTSIPAHLQHWPGLYVRVGDSIVDAPKDDALLAMTYPFYEDRGRLIDGRRITIMTSDETVAVGGEVRIIHVMEAPEPGVEVYVMGPKTVYGEFVNGVLQTEPDPEWEDPFVPEIYNGAVLPAPAVDYNYEITSYAFDEPGTYRIQWILYPWKSNVIKVEVTSGP